jgi:hypothetical protein
MDSFDWSALAAAWDEFVRVAVIAIAAYLTKLAKDALKFYVIDKVKGRAAGLVVGQGESVAGALGYARRSLPGFLGDQTDQHVEQMIQGQIGKLVAPAAVTKAVGQ